jgi:hypothetical protein
MTKGTVIIIAALLLDISGNLVSVMERMLTAGKPIQPIQMQREIQLPPQLTITKNSPLYKMIQAVKR